MNLKCNNHLIESLNPSLKHRNLTLKISPSLTAEAIGEQVIVVQKGSSDAIANGKKGTNPIHCSTSGSGRRCGGQGDLLSGAISVFTSWSKNRTPKSNDPASPDILACYAACRLVRESNAEAFQVKRRGMLASDMIDVVAPTFHRLFEAR